jgi:hypothetical protein
VPVYDNVLHSEGTAISRVYDNTVSSPHRLRILKIADDNNQCKKIVCSLFLDINTSNVMVTRG